MSITGRNVISKIDVVDAYHDVATANATTNTVMSDVVGNKEDTAVTTVGTQKTLMAYLKGILSLIPGEVGTTVTGTIIQDSAAGTGTADVVSVTTNATGSTFGNWATLDASASADVWISHVTVSIGYTGGASVAASTVVEIGTGGSPSTIIRFSHNSRQQSAAGIQMPVVYALPIPIKVASGTAISARAADSIASANVYQVGISYYTGV